MRCALLLALVASASATCQDDAYGILAEMGLTCKTLIQLFSASGGCEADLFNIAPSTMHRGVFAKFLCPVKCNTDCDSVEFKTAQSGFSSHEMKSVPALPQEFTPVARGLHDCCLGQTRTCCPQHNAEDFGSFGDVPTDIPTSSPTTGSTPSPSTAPSAPTASPTTSPSSSPTASPTSSYRGKVGRNCDP